ncbi:MAG: hypothetical protein H6Q19_1239 [Bacteroidetes bacterium]|nr:hypothetical protein [Bacteroidota bacterium]
MLLHYTKRSFVFIPDVAASYDKHCDQNKYTTLNEGLIKSRQPSSFILHIR